MVSNDAGQSEAEATLGQIIKKARTDLGMSQRDVEEATGREVSNAYLSQLESGKVGKPSPHILYALSSALAVDYDELMRRAGYIQPTSGRRDGDKHGRAATYSIGNLTAEEEKALLDHLEFVRWKRGRT